MAEGSGNRPSKDELKKRMGLGKGALLQSKAPPPAIKRGLVTGPSASIKRIVGDFLKRRGFLK